MSRTRLMLLLLTLTSVVFSEPVSAQSQGEKKTAEQTSQKTTKVERGPCVVYVTLRGTVEAKEMEEIILRPEVWTNFMALRAVPHGKPVKKGESLIQMDMTKINEAIADQKEAIRAAEVSLQLAEEELNVLTKTTELDLENAKKTLDYSAEDLDQFLKVNRPATEENAAFRVKNAKHFVEYTEEELRQLEKMYKAKDLTEETEEIILKRQRNELENAQYFLKNTERFTKQMLEIFLPREERQLRENVRRLTIAHDKAKMTLPLALEQKKLSVARQRRELEKSRERLAKLESDARMMAVPAPADGLVYYGRCVRGQWLQMAEIERMLALGQVPIHNVLFTIVKPQSVHVRATAEEKDFEALAVDQSASITPVALPKMKLNGKVASLGRILLPVGGFDVTLRIGNDQPPEGLLPGYSVTAKVKTYSKDDALLLPASVIFTEDFDDEAKFVWLAGKEPKKQPVKLGQKMGDKVEIVEGLTEGDEVLTEKPADKKGK